MNYKQQYEKDPDFKLYVDKYAKQLRITVEEALTHFTVQETCHYYNDINQSKSNAIQNDYLMRKEFDDDKAC